MCLFFYGEKMNIDALVTAEHDLFCKVCDGKFLFKDEINLEIRKIINVYVQYDEVKSFMQKYDVVQHDFEYMYYVLFSVSDFFEYLYVGKIKCLFPTAVLLDEKVMKFMETHFEYRHKFINETREDFLNITAMNVGNLFFRTEAVKQNIVDRDYYLNTFSPDID